MDSITHSFLSFKEALAKMVRSKVKEPVEIEDIVQEAYARCYKAGKTQEISSPKAFMARTAINLASNHIASAAYRLNGAFDEFDPAINNNEPYSLEDQVDSERLFAQLCQAIEQLPVQCRRVFILKQVYGFSQREIATRLDISEKAVEYHVSKGLFKCRKYLKALQSPPSTSNVTTPEAFFRETY